MVLLQAEIEAVRFMNSTKYQSKIKPQLNRLIDGYLKQLDYDM